MQVYLTVEINSTQLIGTISRACLQLFTHGVLASRYNYKDRLCYTNIAGGIHLLMGTKYLAWMSQVWYFEKAFKDTYEVWRLYV